ncbi:MAG: SDR family NAD(P)-dependent oxidoreductase [Lachnospiraceae bacterium]
MEQTDKILITGAAGFIGSYLAEKLLKEQFQVIGIDNLNDYYDVRLKEERLKKLDGWDTNFKFIRMDIADAAAMKELFEREMGTGYCCESGGTGWRALFYYESGCLYREQSARIL